MHRMVGRLSAELQDLQMFVRCTRGLGDRILEIVGAHVVGTGTGHQDAVARDQLHGKLVQALIGRQRFG